MEQEIERVLKILKDGGIILYPTDTVWGIGCDATREDAVDRIYKLKRSDNKHSMLVLCHDLDTVVRYAGKAPSVAFEVMEMSEKPLTAILPGARLVAQNLIPPTCTLGVRVPKHEFCEKLLYRFRLPLVSTSANISGEATPKTFSEISREIIDNVDYVVNPKYEGKPTKKASSIISFGEDGSFSIIRQ